MRKRLTALCLCVFLALASAPAALALDTGGLTGALPESAREILGDPDPTDAAAGEGLFRSLWEWVKAHLTEMLAEAARSAGIVFAVTLLISALSAAVSGEKTPGYLLAAGAVAIFGAGAGDFRSYLGLVTTALGDLSDFSKALLPCLTAASAAAGRAASATAGYAVSALFLDMLMSLGVGYVLPAIYAYAAVSAADAALPEGALEGPVKLIAWGCRTLLIGLTTVFTLALTTSGVISRNADRLAGTAAKAAVSAALPVVGSILSDAADTYLAGAQLVRGAVGMFGLAAVLAVCVGPILRLGFQYLLFRAAACLLAPFAEKRLAGLVERLADAFGLALGLVGSACAMLFVSVSVGMGVLAG